MMKIFGKFVGLKNRLTRLSDDEPVTMLALAIIIILDVFILTIIFRGLDDHTDQLTSPRDYFPPQCKAVYVDKNWSQQNKMEKLQYLVLSDYNNYSYRNDSPFQDHKIAEMHPLCAKFYKRVKVMADDNALRRKFVERQDITNKRRELVRLHDRENEVYDTALLENIADKGSSKLESMAASIGARTREIDRLDERTKALDGEINADPRVADFWALLKLGDETLRAELIADINRYDRLYLFKELLWQMLFLVPLLVIFGIWHTKSVNKERRIQALIAAHLIVVASIPIVLKVLEVVLDLIPYHFFKGLFELCERLHIIALWHYGVIGASIVGALFAVFVIQKKIFNKQRLHEKRLIKGTCYGCGKKLPEKTVASCPFCGSKQVRTCQSCGKETYMHAKFCTRCGAEG